MVALLRGVNVGGRSTLPMATLREIAERCGYARVRTYIQSGNVVFTARGSEVTVGRELAAAIAAATDLSPSVAVRTAQQLGSVVERNPLARRGADPSHLHVVFLPSGPAATLGSLDVASYEPEEVVASGHELYLSLPGGVGRSRLAADLARGAAKTGTMRNWRTVGKLVELLAEPA